ncbi:APC family permease [uncultured Dysosmobacter sp.]|uniref:APC family permease n=1 Tax=uncultured Dysosmobacter sp. TaxID=2591384 RepID=UPI002628A4AC|nr:APC family permease [uncultured Dysosmobacter sp.]
MEKKKLNLFSLVCIATGNVIGAGIITTTGLAIAQTGRSVWISYGLAVVTGLLWIMPTIIFSGIAKYKGGSYTMITACMGEKWGGVGALWWLPMFLMQGMMGAALGAYVSSLVPAIPPNIAGIVMVTIFYVVNLFGVKSMSKLQNPTTVFLLIGLVVFAVVGLFHLNDGAFQVTSSEYYLNGGIGLLDGLMLLVFSTSGHALVCSCSWDSDKPKKNIPLAILISTAIILVLYMSVSFVAGNVLPVETVAGQPLTFVAKEIFPGPLFIIFIIAGPIMALATSTNSGFPTLTAPVEGAVSNGWLPPAIAKHNKYDVPWILYTALWLIAVLPLIMGVSLSALTAYTVLTMRISSLLGIIAAFYIPTKFKESWETSWLHMPNGLYYVLCALSLVTNLIAIFLSVRTISPPVFLANLGVVAVLAAVALIRYKLGKTKVNVVYTLDEDQD